MTGPDVFDRLSLDLALNLQGVDPLKDVTSTISGHSGPLVSSLLVLQPLESKEQRRVCAVPEVLQLNGMRVIPQAKLRLHRGAFSGGTRKIPAYKMGPAATRFPQFRKCCYAHSTICRTGRSKR